jgi:hypothetical protein
LPERDSVYECCETWMCAHMMQVILYGLENGHWAN